MDLTTGARESGIILEYFRENSRASSAAKDSGTDR